MRAIALVLTLAAVASSLSAQAPRTPIATDRPDFTESSALVPRGRVQFESGITFGESSKNSGAVRSTTYPELLARYGLTSRLELRAGQSFVHLSQPVAFGGSFTAREDIYVGIKLGLGDQRNARPQLALMLQSTFPTGDDRVSQSTHPGLALLAGWSLSSVWSLALGVQANRITGDAYEIAPSASLGRALSSRLTAFGELYALVPVLSEYGAPKPAYANGGLSLLLSDDVQVDARIGGGLGGSADRYFFGFGFAIRH